MALILELVRDSDSGLRVPEAAGGAIIDLAPSNILALEQVDVLMRQHERIVEREGAAVEATGNDEEAVVDGDAGKFQCESCWALTKYSGIQTNMCVRIQRMYKRWARVRAYRGRVEARVRHAAESVVRVGLLDAPASGRGAHCRLTI